VVEKVLAAPTVPADFAGLSSPQRRVIEAAPVLGRQFD